MEVLEQNVHNIELRLPKSCALGPFFFVHSQKRLAWPHHEETVLFAEVSVFAEVSFFADIIQP